MNSLLIWMCLVPLGGGAPSLVQLELGSSLRSSLSRVGRWNQWVFDKDNARLLLLFKGTPEGVKVWTNGLQLAVGPPDQQVATLPSLPLADAESLKRAARREELAREEEVKREEELKAKHEEELKHAKLPSLPVAPLSKIPKKEVAAVTQQTLVTKQTLGAPIAKEPVIPQPLKTATQPKAAAQTPLSLPSIPVAPHVASPVAPPVAVEVPKNVKSVPVALHVAPQVDAVASQPAAPSQQATQVVATAAMPSSQVADAGIQKQDSAPDPNVSPWTEVVYHAFKKDAGGDKAHLRKCLMEWLQHESDFSTRTWISQKVEQLEKHVKLGLIATSTHRNGNQMRAHNSNYMRARNGNHMRARNRNHMRARNRNHMRLRNGNQMRARNGKGLSALDFEFGGQSASEWARSLDDDSDSPPPPPKPKKVVHHHGWHEMSEERRKRMVDKLLQFARGSKFLHPTETTKKDVKKTVAHVLNAAAALQKSSTPKKQEAAAAVPKQQVSLAQGAQDAANAAAEQKTQAAARARVAAELAQKQAAEAAAAQKAQALAAKAAAAQSAAAAQAAQKAQAEAEAAAAAQKAQAKAAEAAAKQKAAEAAAAERAQQAAEAAAAAQKAAEEAIAQQQAAEAQAAAAAKKAAAAAIQQRKLLHKQLKKALAHGKEAWITQAVQSATSLADAKRKYNALLLNAQMEAAKKFQLESSNSLSVKVSNEELKTLSFSGELVGEEAFNGGMGPVTAEGSWHIALPQVKEETDAGTMTLAPNADAMVFVMLGGGRYSAVLPLRPGAGKKMVESKWRPLQEAEALESLPAGGTVSAPLKGVGQFWQAWKKKKAALAKKNAAKKSHKAGGGAHHRMQQMNVVNPLAMAAPQTPASKQVIAPPATQGQPQHTPAQPAQAQTKLPQPMAQTMLPAPMQIPAGADPLGAILAASQPQTAVPAAAQRVAHPPAPQAKVAVAAPIAATTPSPPSMQISPYSAPVSPVDDVITAAALSNSKLPSSWTSSGAGHA